MSVYDFYREAMEALGIPIVHLVPENIPADALLTRDTSLQAVLMHRLTGIEPLPVRETLEKKR